MRLDHFKYCIQILRKGINPASLVAVILLIIVLPIVSIAQETSRQFTADYSSIAGMIRYMEAPEREEWQKPYSVISLFGDLENKTVVDLGSGSGYFTFKLAMKAEKVIAADVDDRYLSYISEKLLKPEFSDLRKRIELRKIPYENPGLKGEEADGILVVNTFHHIENRIDYFKNAVRGMKPGGKIIIVDYIKGIDFGPSDDHKTDINQAMEELKQVGFSQITIKSGLLEYQFIILCEK